MVSAYCPYTARSCISAVWASASKAMMPFHSAHRPPNLRLSSERGHRGPRGGRTHRACFPSGRHFWETCFQNTGVKVLLRTLWETDIHQIVCFFECSCPTTALEEINRVTLWSRKSLMQGKNRKPHCHQKHPCSSGWFFWCVFVCFLEPLLSYIKHYQCL